MRVGPDAVRGDAKLVALRQLLVPLRGHDPATKQNERGASPVFQLAKHELRDWIESRLPPPGDGVDPTALAKKLNQELKARKLIFDASDLPLDQTGVWKKDVGYVGEIHMESASVFVIVQTGLGVMCGFDESAYLFEWRGGRWRVRWTSEENDYSDDHYVPLHWQHVLVSPSNPEDDYLVLTVGMAPWCSSNWSGGLIYRVWRTQADSPPKLLLDYSESERVYWGNGDSQAALGSNDVLIQFAVGTMDSAVHNHPAVRHYRVEGDQVTQVDPFVLIPRDFVDTWMSDSWTVSADRSEAAHLKRLEEAHKGAGGMFEGIWSRASDYLRRCTDDRQIWQVRLFQGAKTIREFQEHRDGEALYFLVRWQQPYRFTMVDVRETPSPMLPNDFVDPDGEKAHSPFADAK